MTDTNNSENGYDIKEGIGVIEYEPFENKDWSQYESYSGNNYTVVEPVSGESNVIAYIKNSCAQVDGKYEPKTIGIYFPEAGGINNKDLQKHGYPTTNNAINQALQKNESMPDMLVVAKVSTYDTKNTSLSVIQTYNATTELCGENYKNAAIGIGGGSKGCDMAVESTAYFIAKGYDGQLKADLDVPVNYGAGLLGTFVYEKSKRLAKTIADYDNVEICVTVEAGKAEQAKAGLKTLINQGMTSLLIREDGDCSSSNPHINVLYNSITDGVFEYTTGESKDFLADGKRVLEYNGEKWSLADLSSDITPENTPPEETAPVVETPKEETPAVEEKKEETVEPVEKEEPKETEVPKEEEPKEEVVKDAEAVKTEASDKEGSEKTEKSEEDIVPTAAAEIDESGATKDTTVVEAEEASKTESEPVQLSATDRYLLGVAALLGYDKDFVISEDIRYVYEAMEGIKSAVKSVQSNLPEVKSGFASDTQVPNTNSKLLSDVVASTNELLDLLTKETENMVKIAISYKDLDEKQLDKILNIPSLDAFNLAFGGIGVTPIKDDDDKEPGKKPPKKTPDDDTQTETPPETPPETPTETPTEEGTQTDTPTGDGTQTETPTGDDTQTEAPTDTVVESGEDTPSTESTVATPIKDGKGGNKTSTKKSKKKKKTKTNTSSNTTTEPAAAAPATSDDYNLDDNYEFNDYPANDETIDDTPSSNPVNNPTPASSSKKKSGVPWGTIGGVAAAGLAAGAAALGIHSAVTRDKNSPYQYEDKNSDNVDSNSDSPGEPEEVDHYDVPLSEQYKVYEENKAQLDEGGDI